ncbi:hypothetical protein N2152v2_004321 [Parachlorella kessleri]
MAPELVECVDHLSGQPHDFVSLADATLRVHGHRLPVHAAILSQHSVWFRTLFSSLKEGVAASTTGGELELPEHFGTLELPSFCAFLRLLYNLTTVTVKQELVRVQPEDGEVVFEYHVEALLALAHQFDVPKLFSLIEEVASEDPSCRLALLMDPLRWLLVCDEYQHLGHLPKVRSTAISFLTAKFSSLQTDPRLESLSVPTLCEVVRMVGYRLSMLGASCGHVQAVQDRAVQRFTATAQQAMGALLAALEAVRASNAFHESAVWAQRHAVYEAAAVVAAGYCPDASQAGSYVTHWWLNPTTNCIKLSWSRSSQHGQDPEAGDALAAAVGHEAVLAAGADNDVQQDPEQDEEEAEGEMAAPQPAAAGLGLGLAADGWAQAAALQQALGQVALMHQQEQQQHQQLQQLLAAAAPVWNLNAQPSEDLGDDFVGELEPLLEAVEGLIQPHLAAAQLAGLPQANPGPDGDGAAGAGAPAATAAAAAAAAAQQVGNLLPQLPAAGPLLPGAPTRLLQALAYQPVGQQQPQQGQHQGLRGRQHLAHKARFRPY